MKLARRVSAIEIISASEEISSQVGKPIVFRNSEIIKIELNRSKVNFYKRLKF